MSHKLSPRPDPLSVPNYMLKARESLRFADDERGLEYVRYGFFGEIGGLLSAVKKSVRDNLDENVCEMAGEELGDALWYLFITAHLLGVAPNELGQQCLCVLRENFDDTGESPETIITFRHIDSLIDVHMTTEGLVRSTYLGELAKSAGALADMTYGALQSLAIQRRAEYLGKLMAWLALSCASFKLSLEKVAQTNISKTASRWPKDNGVYPKHFDEDMKPHEQFPRIIKMDFIEREQGDYKYVVQRMHGVYIGDRLTDNSHEVDDYRFHDIFHLAYVAHLGWSPVLRSLMKRKRKSNPKLDENEDGARAAIIEEGIATWIFNHAKYRNHYIDVSEGSLDYGLLKQISSMVRGYEVEKCALWQWERAILQGFMVFRQLQKDRCGTVEVDMDNHTLKFTPLEKDSDESE